MLGLVRPDGDKVIVGLGVGLGDDSEVCANDGKATKVAVTTAISELDRVFIDAILSETGRRRQVEPGKGSSGHSQIPSSRSWIVARRAQSRFAAGLAGLGCKIRPRRICPPARICSARLKAKSPTATSHWGRRIRTTSRKCSSQAANSAARSDAGSLSGVRLRPLLST